ncbi:tRNA (adenosine(37)-N6)-threonylcarbamoyltransferase complex dimerization subunit type 1 TsaB [Massilia sp. P8910]|uniref:tRNA (adenosine(37)-N6)-threonylcarbamoyltransferase complex dimerization subunit type 1 TsaB n=1 Tax=Massilia antarctica TaxID=2765360 RepID=UPI0006BB734D|nr:MULTISPECIES: tRNA (adenosine(37)-N6)-threonylcarbamoyltransferase complex dimerization subunit type 1 TsaB [Massilia]MCE3605130.1 tRNA (adenosine(37)-N6)-threonylcarbamoyltransferase complex dimerization subunit type 1 TsaB [Massilia antarctica]MCY0912681.1 tRNA (adenosine(37)-N6)-threonylcarbamoyltransferase complex dimerization subunit type 1 TsaB [Massilia sp. H27-R4]
MSIILAIETSSEMASCALLRGDAVLFRESSGVRTHSQAILPMVQELLAEAGIALKECDAIAFGAGPGSFTGVRTACGIAQGLAYGAGLPVLSLITLEAMAVACRQQHGAADVVAVLDARMGEVYWAQYRYDDAAARWEVLHAPTLCAPGAVAPLPVDGPLAACGNGLAAYPDAFGFAQAYPEIMPHAAQMALLGRGALAAGEALGAAQAQPLYLRNKIAYTSAERSAINAAKAAA